MTGCDTNESIAVELNEISSCYSLLLPRMNTCVLVICVTCVYASWCLEIVLYERQLVQIQDSAGGVCNQEESKSINSVLISTVAFALVSGK